MCRRRALNGIVVERRMHVREDGACGFKPRNPAKRLVEREMARMRAVLQRVDDQDIEISKPLDRRRRKIADVWTICQPADAEAE